MRHGRFLFVVPFGLAFIFSLGLDVGQAADDELEQTDEAVETSDEPEPPAVPLTLLPVPKIKLAHPLKATEAEAKEIRELIGALEQIEEWDLGLGHHFGPAGFAQIPPNWYDSYLHLLELRPNPSIRKLVEYGPKAIPFLLKALDDHSHSKLTFEETTYRLSNDLSTNPVNISEAAVAEQVKAQRTNKRDGSGYTANVGDICFVVLGQITNRCYAAVAENADADYEVALIVNSAVKNSSLAKSVRDIWGDSDHAEKLFQSLLIDYNTRGDDEPDFQVGAALRLAFYFPAEASLLIAERLKGLDVTTEDLEQQYTTNGVDAADFVHAVSWSTDSRVTDEVLKIFEKTPDEDITLACLPGVGKQHDEVVFDRLVKFLKTRAHVVDIEVGCDPCLLAIGERFPDRAKTVFQEYLVNVSVLHRWEMCYVLRQTCGRFSIDLLSGLLDDNRKTVLYQIRICDLAAKTISMNFPDLKFEVTGKPGDKDRQIAEMKRKIADMKKVKE